jgi:hypothetical protein
MPKETQLTRGQQRRLMYIENKDGNIDGADGRIGWVTFSKTGQTDLAPEERLPRLIV